ncbi:3-hydroxyacyl-[acp] dehydratase [Campylobacter blaseri]|uniref:3-hydroxyacyl-[acyl-carrier-protein] dehydratase FabZ n=1 Tax=Campylobacter blaseri TaxID=2042961 RepID=A0A2P8R136_9BACT|nr:3-hydroxyacyl-ACP dehydratase FabZ [Campylobacter blaseri]PSM52205.1 3-hydroxyacyl-[acyl-carrier-protein] dehydratase FabZ [Campylobacter blaseri]PSM53971.1 3-hydroxyacyl-[acyl-carrier-protein] dehydratase FabZ [Campylobacter blaseri]QKF85409.1 3-hydroxyacyl-[acp] dehydratase [Campylobacter blaseri]
MLDVNDIMKILPHRYPFLLIDRVIEVSPGESIEAYKNVTIGDHIFQGHFPGHPIYPGVMILEGMAQAGGVLAFKSDDDGDFENKVVYFMTIDKAKFRHPIRPGDKLVYKINVLKHRGRIWVLEGKAYVDDKLAAQAEFQAMIMDK